MHNDKPTPAASYAKSLRELYRGNFASEEPLPEEVVKVTKSLMTQDASVLECQLRFFEEYQHCGELESRERAKSKVRRPHMQFCDMGALFFELLPLWNQGLISTMTASSQCHVSEYIFIGRAMEHNRRQCLEDASLAKSACMDFFSGRISSELAARRLGLCKSQFLSFISQEGFQKQCLPDVILEAFAAWTNGRLKKLEAAKHCSLSLKQFHDCLVLCHKPTVAFYGTNTGNSYYERALRLYQQGIVTQAACAELCETKPVRFFARLLADGAKVERRVFMPPPRAFPKGFCQAYRDHMEGKLSAAQAAKACSLPLKVFLEWKRKLEFGEDFERERARVDAEVKRWQMGEIPKTKLLKILRMPPKHFKIFCQEEKIQGPENSWKKGRKLGKRKPKRKRK